ncbi:MAG: chemotaxis response regulator protein-glutamate methylesterase [Rhodospirillaceae bacterium]
MQPAVSAGAPEAKDAGKDARKDDSALRILIVDDSAVIRGLLRRTLEEDPEVIVVASVSNGQQAIDVVARQPIDVVLLDIEMPVMDGMTALPKILAANPAVRVIMASTLTERNAEISLKALRQGASDYIAKPTAKHELHSARGFREELIEKVKALAGRRVGRTTARAAGPQDAAGARSAAPVPIALRPPSARVPRIVCIGSSTGGPQALFTLFQGLRGKLGAVPVVITQHMPKAFTGILAQHLGKVADLPCAEGVDNEPLLPGRIYIAPGDYHMTVQPAATGHRIHLDQNPPENFCRPSVEPLFRSVSAAFEGSVLAIMLTGMGHDGSAASRALVDAGGTLVAQDEKSSVVWGMPGAVAQAGICADVLPIDAIAPRVIHLLRRN